MRAIILGGLAACALCAQLWAGVMEVTHHSDALGRERNLSVYVPPGYDGSGAYPTVYLLHGYAAETNNAYWEKKYAIGKVLDELIATGRIRPFVVVMPDSSMRWKASGYTFCGSFYVNTVAGRYEDYVMEDVIEYVEQHFAVSPDPARRAVMGHSMGGLGALHYAMKYGKSRFGAVVAHSGPTLYPLIKHLQPLFNRAFTDGHVVSKLVIKVFGLLGISPAEVVDFPGEDALEAEFSAQRSGGPEVRWDNLRGLYVYLSCGDKDEKHMYPLNKLFVGQLSKRRIDHTFVSYEGDHDNRLLEMIKDSFTRLGAALP